QIESEEQRRKQTNTERKNRETRETAQREKKNPTMAESLDVNAKWDACIDLTVRRVVYSSMAGAFSGLLFFRSPVSRWAAVGFGAGVGVGAAYTECSRIFEGSPTTLPAPKVASAPPSPPPKVVESPPAPQEDKTEI
ncbi:hypothetical protein LINPERHAP2_LOCUS32019, partial [Linum perenne]